MEVDEFLFKRDSGLFLRVYGWTPPAVSIGFGQKAEKELDLAGLKEAGIDVVRRLTGGRAVLHDREITYSVAGDTGGIFGPDLHSTFLKIAEALRETLLILGVKCEIEKGGARDVRSRTGASPPCFSSVSRYELKVDGRKIIGSAQRRDRGRFLQHGSLMIEKGRDITDFLLLVEAKREACRKELDAESVSLGEVLGKAPSYETCAEAFKQGFSESWGMEILVSCK